jgi:uncharacterized membrane protein YhaH (DUF805 family)
MSRPLRRVLLLGPPLGLAVWETIHPRPDLNVESVMEIATWFMAYHLVQLPLTVLLAVSVYLLADSLGRAHAWTTLVGLAVFLAFFSAYDAWAGMATGDALRTARDFSSAEQDAVWEIVEDWPGFHPVALPIAIIASLGLLLVLAPLAMAARRAGASRAQWILLLLAGIFFLGGHPFPFGTLAFGCLFLGALLLEWRPVARAADEAVAAPPRSNAV